MEALCWHLLKANASLSQPDWALTAPTTWQNTKLVLRGVLMVIEHQAKKLKVFGDSALVIYQLHGEWETRDSKLIPYHNYVMEMSECFNRITFHYITWDKNQMADTLATLSSML
ncbi:hypothetical protein CR513_04928, partial [Mucuna pruriens]